MKKIEYICRKGDCYVINALTKKERTKTWLRCRASVSQHFNFTAIKSLLTKTNRVSIIIVWHFHVCPRKLCKHDMNVLRKPRSIWGRMLGYYVNRSRPRNVHFGPAEINKDGGDQAAKIDYNRLTHSINFMDSVNQAVLETHNSQMWNTQKDAKRNAFIRRCLDYSTL